MKFANKEKPPVCLHVLGQGLVDACHAEARELLAQRDSLIEAAKALIEGADDEGCRYASYTGYTVNEDHLATLSRLIDSMKEE